MAEPKQPRFRIAKDGAEDAPNIVEFKLPTRHREPNPEVIKPREPKPSKRMDAVDMALVRLDPERFQAPATQEMLAPAVAIQMHIPVILDILMDAVRRSEDGGEVSLTANQWKLLLTVYEVLAVSVADLAHGAASLEWSMVLSSVLLAHLWEHPTSDEAKRVQKAHTGLINRMMRHMEKEESENE